MSSEPLLAKSDSETVAAVGPESQTETRKRVAKATIDKQGSILFRIKLQDAKGKHVPVYEVANKTVGFLCSAGRYAACQELAVLVDKFLETHPNFAIIYLSLDLSEAAFNKTLRAHPKWLAIPYNDPVKLDILNEWQQRSVPCLHIYDPVDHFILTSWGGSCLRFNSENCFQEWRQGGAGVSFLQILTGWWSYTPPAGEFRDITEEELAQHGFPGSVAQDEEEDPEVIAPVATSKPALQDQRVESKKNK
ncbi:Nucleoredoxin-like protein 2 [Podila verticillata]|nr:Nucleoredoxin-like protein 2 [Podila verticillata]